MDISDAEALTGGYSLLNAAPEGDEDQQIRAELGLSLNLPLTVNRFDGAVLGNPELAGYTFTVIGCRLRAARMSQEPPVYELWDGGELELNRANVSLHHACHVEGWEGERLVLIGDPNRLRDWLVGRRVTEQSLLLVYSHRAYYQGSSVYAEERRYPFGMMRRTIGGLERPHTEDDVLRAARSFQYLDELGSSRREQPGVKAYDRDDERREVYQAVANALEKRMNIGRASLSGELALSTDGFDDKRERCGLKLAELRRMTLADLAFMGIYPEMNTNR